MSKRARIIRDIVIGIVIAASISTYVLWPVLTFGPQGQNVPLEPPDESRRLFHPDGFSIVMPPNWETPPWALRSGETLTMWPRKPFPSRGGTSINVFQLKAPPKLDGRSETIFQNKPAFENRAVLHDWQLDDPYDLSEYGLVFERGGSSYRIIYQFGAIHEEVPEMIRRYLETFRLEGQDVRDDK